MRRVGLPRLGETLLAATRSVDVGGKGLNQAIAAHRAGASVRLVALIGGDPAGERIRAALIGEGLDPGLFVPGEAPTDQSVILVAEDGENAIISTGAAARRLSPADVTVVESLGRADTLLMQGGIPVATTARCLELARDRGARVVVSTVPLLPGGELLVRVADVLVVNAGEARGLTGAEEPMAAAEALAARGAGVVVVTRDAASLHLFAGGAHYCVPVPPAEAVDTTGAGDVLTGVLVAALDAGDDLPWAAACAAHAASLKVARRGTGAGFPTATELAALPAAT